MTYQTEEQRVLADGEKLLADMEQRARERAENQRHLRKIDQIESVDADGVARVRTHIIDDRLEP